jgi:hypothetical protein
MGLPENLQSPYLIKSFSISLWEVLSSSVELEHKAYWALKFFNFDHTALGERRKLQLRQLDEIRLHAYEPSRLYKERMK